MEGRGTLQNCTPSQRNVSCGRVHPGTPSPTRPRPILPRVSQETFRFQPPAGDFSSLNGSTRQRKRGNSEALPILCYFPSYVQAMLSSYCSVGFQGSRQAAAIQENIVMWLTGSCGELVIANEQILTSYRPGPTRL
jgi:hypothetical protein